MKNRHIKTIPEKFGLGDLRNDCNDIIKHNNNKISSIEIFNLLPYLGIFYIPTEYKELWYDFEEPTLVSGGVALLKAKMIYVDNEEFVYCHFDDHHMQIVTRRSHFKITNGPSYVLDTLYYMESNIIKKY